MLALAITAAAPASYCWRYLTHRFELRDITLPPEDLSWKSKSQFYRSLAILTLLLGIGIFIFTPQAEAFARSEWLFPTLAGVFASFALATVVPGWRNREIQPLLNGVHGKFRREDQPKRYWASLAWNTLVGCALFVVSLGIVRDNLTPECDDPDTEDRTVLNAALAECDAMLSDAPREREGLAELYAARGRVHHRLGQTDEAVRDYSRAIADDPGDAYSLRNRGALLLYAEKLRAAIADLDASLALEPDNEEAYYDRGVAHALLGHRQLAERDFLRSGVNGPPWSALLLRRAEIAIDRKNYTEAIELATQTLETEPENMLALQLRAEAYWKLGQLDLSTRDDDRVRALSDARRSP